MPTEPFPLEPAIWYDTAVPPPPTSVLNNNLDTNIVVIGAGYAGLNTALRLADLGYKPVVLEAHEIGYGGSGRNGGQIVPGLKWDPETLRKHFKGEAGDKIVQFAGNTPNDVYENVDRFNMDVHLQRSGWLQPAHNEKGLKLAEKRYKQWRAEGADVDLISASDMSKLLGTNKYAGGWIDRRGGGIQPLSYARELGRAALELGAQIYTNSPVTELQKHNNRWKVITNTGHYVTADLVIMCTNAYTSNLIPGINQSIIAANSYQLATEPLPAEVANSILPMGHVASDTKQLLFYFRKDHKNRFMMGGRGPFREPISDQDWDHLKRAAIKMFPALNGYAWNYKWCGRVAITKDLYPHIHEPEPNLIVNIGCMGRGVGLQTSMGKAIANYVHTRNEQDLPVPITKFTKLPLYPLRKFYVGAVVTWYRITDGGMD